jgi:translation initiation factor 2 gamma subunit (eIF-2gamma)
VDSCFLSTVLVVGDPQAAVTLMSETSPSKVLQHLQCMAMWWQMILMRHLLFHFAPCRRYLVATSLARAAEMQAQVRVVKQQPPAVLAGLLDSLFSPQVRRRLLF